MFAFNDNVSDEKEKKAESERERERMYTPLKQSRSAGKLQQPVKNAAINAIQKPLTYNSQYIACNLSWLR